LYWKEYFYLFICSFVLQVRAAELRKILIELGPVCNAGYFFSGVELFFFNLPFFSLIFGIFGSSNSVMARVIGATDLFILPD